MQVSGGTSISCKKKNQGGHFIIGSKVVPPVVLDYGRHPAGLAGGRTTAPSSLGGEGEKGRGGLKAMRGG